MPDKKQTPQWTDEEKAFFVWHSDADLGHPWLAVLLTLFSPGAAFIYNDRILRGILINLGFAIMVFAFFVAWAIFEFFPLLPAACVCMIFIGIILWCFISAYLLAKKSTVRNPIERNPVFLFSTSLLTFWIPLLFSIFCSVKWIYQETWSANNSMFPNIMNGDVVLVDRSEFLFRDPKHGELVLIEDKSAPRHSFYARIVASPGDTIQLDGMHPVVNGKKLQQFIPKPTSELHKLPHFTVELPSQPAYTLSATGEETGYPEPEFWYTIISSQHLSYSKTDTIKLAPDTYFVLEDNRESTIKYDYQGQFGRFVQRSWIMGQPKFIAYNREHENLKERYALRLH